MSKSISSTAQTDTSNQGTVLTTSALLTAIAGIVLVDAEILAVAGTAVYALSNALGAGSVGLAVIAALVGMPALWLCWQVARLAIAAERDAMKDI